jgi:mycothiol synthase
MEMSLPAPYGARPYGGRSDHPAMAAILAAYNVHAGVSEQPTAAQLDATYANLSNCDPAVDVAIVERAGVAVAYARTYWGEAEDGTCDHVVFAPCRPEHLSAPLHAAIFAAMERHVVERVAATGETARLRAFAPHPGPGREAVGESAWLEARGYTAVRFAASLVRPDLDDIPDRTLPAGVEVRPVTGDQLRVIWAAHQEAFRGEWDFHEPTEEEFREFVDNPLRDESLWKVAWAGDVVVGQVKSYVNDEENRSMGYHRGYTENISTHAAWRNRGIAGALLAMSLRELRDRGYAEAALGADTDNPGGAFHLYTSLGFQLRAYEAAYARPL